MASAGQQKSVDSLVRTYVRTVGVMLLATCEWISLTPNSNVLLHYRPDVLTAVQQCKDDFTVETNSKKKAELSQQLLALLMYTSITPGRCKEYTTLKFVVHEDLPAMRVNPEAPNCVHITARGDAAAMVLADHKTSKRYGSDHILLSGDSPLLRHLSQHIQLYRHVLSGTEDNNCLFVVSTDKKREAGDAAHMLIGTHSTSPQNRRGTAFVGAKWTNYIKRIFLQYTGKAIVPTILRSSFVTFNEGQTLPPHLKQSIAASMRHNRSTVSGPHDGGSERLFTYAYPRIHHPLSQPIHGLSPRQALQDYDRRTKIDRNQEAHLYAEGLLQKVLNTSGLDPPTTQEEPPEGPTCNQQQSQTTPMTQEEPPEGSTRNQQQSPTCLLYTSPSPRDS